MNSTQQTNKQDKTQNKLKLFSSHLHNKTEFFEFTKVSQLYLLKTHQTWKQTIWHSKFRHSTFSIFCFVTKNTDWNDVTDKTKTNQNKPINFKQTKLIDWFFSLCFAHEREFYVIFFICFYVTSYGVLCKYLVCLFNWFLL